MKKHEGDNMTNEPDIIDEPTDLVPIEGGPGAPRDIALTPAEEVALTQERARAVVAIIDGAKAYATIQGKKYLQVESWQVIGKFDGVSAATEWTRPIEIGGVIVAYEAKVLLIGRDGLTKGGATMTCGMDEHVAQGKRGWMQHVAVQSMAQTRAESKAYRMNYAAVALLAGYQGTTAEEMQTGGSQPDERNDRDESAPFCEKHGVSFQKFEKDGSTWYSHRDGDSWCAYQKPAKQGGTAAPKVNAWGKEAMATFLSKAKEARGDTAKEDLAHVTDGDTSGKGLKAFAAKHNLNTPEKLFAFCVARWAIRDDLALDELLGDDAPDGNEDADPAKEIADPEDEVRI
jgi:hypothetical protein